MIPLSHPLAKSLNHDNFSCRLLTSNVHTLSHTLMLACTIDFAVHAVQRGRGLDPVSSTNGPDPGDPSTPSHPSSYAKSYLP